MKWAHTKAEELCVEQGLIKTIADFPLVAHVHDEGQMEVRADEVESWEYVIPVDDWKKEEKRQEVDENGRIWSAPEKLGVSEDNTDLYLRRRYHPIGDNYCKALKWAGEHLKLRCETAGEYMIGDNWLDTH